MSSDCTPHPYGIAPPGFRLPERAHPGAVHLQVSDLRQSIRYYEDVVGFRTLAAADDAAALAVRESDAPLVLLRTRPGVEPARRGAFGLYHFAILLPDRPSLGQFAEHLSTVNVRIGMADHLVSEAFYLWDPDGLGIEVYADRPRREWRHHQRELAMTTDPLDVDALIAAGAGAVWDGLPAGTTMGHIHLSVGNLQQAEAFYHRALGFDKTVWSYPGALFLSAGGYHHHLGTNIWSPGPSPLEHHSRLLEWELVVSHEGEIAAAYESLALGGYQVERVRSDAVAADPWGTRVRVTIRAA